MQKYGANEKTQKTIQADTLIGNNQVVKKGGNCLYCPPYSKPHKERSVPDKKHRDGYR